MRRWRVARLGRRRLDGGTLLGKDDRPAVGLAKGHGDGRAGGAVEALGKTRHAQAGGNLLSVDRDQA